MRSRLFTLLAFGLSLPGAAQSLTVSDAIQSALVQNPRIMSAKASTDAASARLTQAQWDRVGRFEIGALCAPELKNPQVTIPAIGPTGSVVRFDLAMQQRNNLEFGFTQPIWTWGALSRRAKAAELQASATADQLSREQQVIRYDATKAFLDAQQSDGLQGWNHYCG